MIVRVRSFPVIVALCCATGWLSAQEGASQLEWQQSKSDLKQRSLSADADIRAEACEALARFNTKEATKLLIESIELSEAQIEELSKHRSDLYQRWEEVKVDWRVFKPDMRQRLDKYRAAQREFAHHYEVYVKRLRALDRMVVALGTVTDDAAVDLMCTKLKTSTSKKNWVVRSTIAEALATVHTPLALETLIAMTDKDRAGPGYDFRIAVRAVQALAGRKEEDALVAILAAVRKPEEWQVRAAAIQAIAQGNLLMGTGVLKEAIDAEQGRLARDAKQALCKLDRKACDAATEAVAKKSFPCLDMEIPSRNLIFLIPAGESMAWKWDNGENPVIPESENIPRFRLARDGVKDYLRFVLEELEAIEDKKLFKPFRFNICIYRGYSEFFSEGMCEINSAKDLFKINEAINWMDWETPNDERVAVGEANLTEALDKCFHRYGFGLAHEEENVAGQPDTLLLMLDTSPNAGAFSYTGEGGHAEEKQVWEQIREFVVALNDNRQIQICTEPIGNAGRNFTGYLKNLANATGGEFMDYTPSAAHNRERNRNR